MASTRFSSEVMPEILEEKGAEEHEQSSEYDMLPHMSKPDHHHHESTSTTSTTSATTSDSTGSSPTTTLSLADDSSVTEMSPGSSPDSPMNKSLTRRPHTADDAPSAPASFFDPTARPAAPGKRARNLKNLAVNTTGNPGGLRGAVTALPPAQNNDTLLPLRTAHASFKRPPSPPKRRPSNLSLTIVTSANNSPANSAVPPTPSLAGPTTLRRFQSSPSMPLVSHIDMPATPLEEERPVLGRSVSDFQSTLEDGFNFEVPQSREEQPEAYPEGPICVFDPYIDLYLEPTAEQASQYDVILNVASEVRNPFLDYTTPDPATEGLRLDGGGGLQYAPKRSRASSSTSNTSHSRSSGSDTPTSAKAAAGLDTSQKNTTTGNTQPEYIHIPWEHNSDIVNDLLRLVKLIDDRVKLGKRILVHCQCGVSRSATMVVAYCMYKSPHYTVQQAYDVVKKRSKWIGPNMNLIMQLQEFSSVLTGTRKPVRHIGRGVLTPIEASAAWNEWRRDSGAPASQISQGPLTAPLIAPDMDVFNQSLGSLSTRSVSPGPSSAPSGLSWPVQEDHADTSLLRIPGRPASFSESTTPADGHSQAAIARRRSSEKKRPTSLLFESTTVPTIMETVIPTIPEVAISAPTDATGSYIPEPLASPRPEEFAMSALQPSASISSDDHFGIMSPTSSNFTHSPLDRAALLGSLGMGSSIQVNQPKPSIPADTRTPHPVVQVATGIFPGMQNLALLRQSALSHPPPSAQSLLDPLLSPRAEAFTINPFAASQPVQRRPSAIEKMAKEDPRSPAHQGSNPIIRNIADAL